MKKNVKTIVLYLLLIGVIVITVSALFKGTQKDKLIYSDIVEYFRTDSVVSFVVDEDYNLTMNVVDKDTSTFDENGICTAFDKNKVKSVNYALRSLELFHTDLEEYIAGNKNLDSYEYEPATSLPWWVSLLPYLLIIVVFIVLWIFMTNMAMGGGKGKLNSFGKARVKTPGNDKDKVLFTDVAGADEEKEELQEIVEFLKEPTKYTALGAKIPHGVLLVGPPGTGKTLLAKAVAGEAGVPFFSISGSDFVEMYVGVGASRVRDLFDNARKFPASIIFIDEIDAVGRHRGAGLGGGHDEREQTLNQLLVEMDGFGSHEGIIVMAATNRPDILDPALLRPGRFDRRITVNAPDIKGREDILKVHARNKKFESDVDFKVIAGTTAGFTGADLANLLNEAALLAARRGKSLIGMADIEDAFMKVLTGPQKKSRRMSEREKRNTAYHEAGHAVVDFYCPTADPVHTISIIPAGQALGVTISLPTEDRFSIYKQELKERISGLLGGRVAEQLTFGDYSGGASNDIQRATELAHTMVTKLGMSEELGPIRYGSSHGDDIFLGRDFTSQQDYSDATAAKIDAEVHRIVTEAYEFSTKVLTEHADKLKFVAEYLVTHEIMDGDQFKAAMEGDVTVEDLEAIKAKKKENSEEQNKKRAEEVKREEEQRRAEAEAQEPEAPESDNNSHPFSF